MLLPWWLLLITGCLATYDIVCTDTTAINKIENAIKDAKAMARNAIDQLADLEKDTTKAAFTPLFRERDVGELTRLYSLLVDVSTIDLHVTFYCQPDFIDRLKYQDGDTERDIWTDTAYTYVNTQGGTESIAIFKVSDGWKKKPGLDSNGNPGGSFATVGFKQTLANGEVADFSKQAHVHVSKRRWDPPANDGYDHRSLDTIIADGLLEFTALDRLKPLAETIHHELMHVLGGTKKPDVGGTRINDKEVLPVITGLIYGYEKCVLVNQHRDDAVFIAQGASPLTRADCPTILAKALYLQQIQGKPTYWSTGTVDKTTLTPDGIPPPPEQTEAIPRRARRMLRQVRSKWLA